MYCTKCGAKLNNNDKVCPKCGTPVDEVSVEAVRTPDDTTPLHNETTTSSSTTNEGHLFGILAIILGLCSSGLLGIILGIIGLNKSTNPEDKKLNYIGIFLPLGCYIVFWTIYICALVFGSLR
jgi:hypothetical protein